jgi:hypothetical protein
MPKLPEVEVLVRHLAPLIRNRKIRNAQVRRAKVLAPTRQQCLDVFDCYSKVLGRESQAWRKEAPTLCSFRAGPIWNCTRSAKELGPPSIIESRL